MLAVRRVVTKATVQHADEAVGQGSQRGVVGGSASPLGVVVGPGTGAGGSDVRQPAP